MEFKESRTYANLMAAFSGESQARNKYTFYADKARKDGYIQIAEFFEETAKNECAHAKLWFDYIQGGERQTGENLVDAANGEHFEWTQMYAEFASVAKEEGYNEIGALFELVAKIEKEHEERFSKLTSGEHTSSVMKHFQSCRSRVMVQS